MPDPAGPRAFPTDDSLCERCGYPLRGLPIEADCPECGQAVAESSPAKRGGYGSPKSGWWIAGMRVSVMMFFAPRRLYRGLSIQGGNAMARWYLASIALVCGLAWGFLWGAIIENKVFAIHAMLGACLAILAMTYIEMLGVTAFSRRRGWRVPFRLAERVCCLAAVGWMPGVLIAGIGLLVLSTFAAGEPWFERLLGLVRVSWICYGGLFVLSLLWFETLVWLGVRQVRYANAWPDDG